MTSGSIFKSTAKSCDKQLQPHDAVSKNIYEWQSYRFNPRFLFFVLINGVCWLRARFLPQISRTYANSSASRYFLPNEKKTFHLDWSPVKSRKAIDRKWRHACASTTTIDSGKACNWTDSLADIAIGIRVAIAWFLCCLQSRSIFFLWWFQV